MGQRLQAKRGDIVRKVKKRIFSGAVLEQITFGVSDRVRNIADAKPPRPRFKDDSERDAHKAGISRRLNAQIVNENFSPTSLYSTLTFDVENEVHTFLEARQIRRNIVRVLKRKCPDAVIYVVMGRGKSTHRIHFHIITEGLPADLIKEKWKYGTVVRTDHLREHNYYDGKDQGQDYTGLANYLWEHWTPEQGGHRWFITKNARRPDIEPAEDTDEDYSPSNPPEAPEGYELVETKQTPYGCCYFKYVKIKRPRRKRKRRPPAPS